MLSPSDRRTTLLRLSCLGLALAMMSRPHLMAAPDDPAPLRGLEEVSHAQVELRGGFWEQRLKTNHKVTVPHALNCLEKDGHVTNFDKAAGTFDGPLRGHHAFDSDLHKALEGAVYSLQHYPDRGLSQRVEGILDRILAAQEKDGFLISYFIVQQREQRWEDLRLEHQMYNAGHFFEMAVAHHRLTGDPRPVPSDLYRVGSPQVPAVGLKLNGQTADASPRADGYVHLQRRWQASDLVELDLPMPVHRVCAHEQVKDDQGQVALMRGPVVYCL